MRRFPRFFLESFPENPVELSLLFCKKFQIFRKGEKVGVGVSGGRDSVFLLHALSFFRSKFGLSEVVCLHFNHRTRGWQSDRDEEFVREMCARLGVPFFSERAPTQLSSEDEMRKERYKFFGRASRELNLDKVATAHNLDDLFETFLLNLKRGGGFMSAIGIYPINYDLCDVPVVRPILPVKRMAISAYLASKGVNYVEDTSNIDIRFSRNRLRMVLSLLPDDLYSAILSGFLRFWLNLLSVLDFIDETYERDPASVPEVIRKQMELYRRFGEFSYEELKRSFTS